MIITKYTDNDFIMPMMYDIDKLEYDPTIQRPTDQAKVKEIASKFDPDQFDPIRGVLRKSNRIMVVDGLHRLAVVKMLEFKQVPVITVEVCTRKQEAGLFVALNSNSKAVSAKDKMKVIANSDAESAERFVLDTFKDYEIYDSSKEHPIKAYGALMKATNLLDVEEIDGLAYILSGLPAGELIKAWMINAVVDLIRRNSNMEPERLHNALGKHFAGIAKEFNKRGGVNGGDQSVKIGSNVFAEYYNKGLKSDTSKISGAPFGV